MKKIEAVERLTCDFCGRPITGDDDYREYEYPGCQPVHIHFGCFDRLPNWMSDDAEFVLSAIMEGHHMTRPAKGLFQSPTIADFANNTDKVRLRYFPFIRTDESAWAAECNNMEAVKAIWRDNRDNHIEGIYHDGRFHKVRIEVKITLED